MVNNNIKNTNSLNKNKMSINHKQSRLIYQNLWQQDDNKSIVIDTIFKIKINAIQNNSAR